MPVIVKQPRQERDDVGIEHGRARDVAVDPGGRAGAVLLVLFRDVQEDRPGQHFRLGGVGVRERVGVVDLMAACLFRQPRGKTWLVCWRDLQLALTLKGGQVSVGQARPFEHKIYGVARHASGLLVGFLSVVL